jgi:pimeloyl-ACP methyl ester carboxylesterase
MSVPPYLYADGPADSDTPTIVCIHSNPAGNGVWQPFIDAIDGRLSVLVLSIPGHGDHATFNEVAEAIVQNIQYLLGSVHGPIYLLGESLGGNLAVQIAHTHRKLISRVYVLDAPLSSDKFTTNQFVVHDSVNELQKIIDCMSANDEFQFAIIHNSNNTVVNWDHILKTERTRVRDMIVVNNSAEQLAKLF